MGLDWRNYLDTSLNGSYAPTSKLSPVLHLIVPRRIGPGFQRLLRQPFDPLHAAMLAAMISAPHAPRSSSSRRTHKECSQPQMM